MTMKTLETKLLPVVSNSIRHAKVIHSYLSSVSWSGPAVAEHLQVSSLIPVSSLSEPPLWTCQKFSLLQ